MFSLSRAVGSPMPLMFGGVMRLLSPLTLRDFGAIEMHIIGSRRATIELAAERASAVPEELQESFMEAAKKADESAPHTITASELDAFMATRAGAAIAGWLSLCKEEDITHADVVDAIEPMHDIEFIVFLNRLRMVSCVDGFSERDWVLSSLSGADSKEEPNWKLLVRKLCESGFGFINLPGDIGGLTLYQLRMLTLSEGNVKGRKMSVDEFREAQRRGNLDGVIDWWGKPKE